MVNLSENVETRYSKKCNRLFLNILNKQNAYVLGYTWADGTVLQNGSYTGVGYECEFKDMNYYTKMQKICIFCVKKKNL